MRLALATCRVLPDEDFDDPPLRAALAEAGIAGETVVWDDPQADWSSWDACLIRSTWDYPHHLPAFLDWVERVGAQQPLWNPPRLVRWNAHKGYLLDLEARGIRVVPTALVRRGETASLERILQERAWGEVVLKPAVSCGSFETHRIGPEQLDLGQGHLARLAAARDVLIQPYLPSVETSGERALVWIDGALTHAVRKTPRFVDDGESVTGPLPIAADERALAEALLEGIDPAPLYARIDLTRDAEGRPCLMELELIEPSLFFAQGPEALQRLVHAIRNRL